MKKISCPVCGTYNTTPYITDKDRLHGLPGTFTLVKCACSTIYLFPMPDVDELAAYYPDDYGAHRPPKSLKKRDRHPRLKRFVLRWYYGCPCGGVAPPRVMRMLVRPVAWLLSKSTLKTMIPWHGKGRILDVGCGNGGWLLRMQDAGWDAHGVELDATAAQHARDAGLDVHNGTLLTAQFPDASFDVIRFHYVFEHLPNPGEILAEVRRILAPDGICSLRIPNCRSVTFALFKKYWFPLDIPRHVIHYTPHGMRTLAKAYGLRVARATFKAPSSGFFTSIGYMKADGVAPWYLRPLNGESRFWRYLWMPFGWLIDLCKWSDIVEYTLTHPAPQTPTNAPKN